MHQGFDTHSSSSDATLALRLALRRALARDLGFPEEHIAVTATMTALAVVSNESRETRNTPSADTRQKGETPNLLVLLRGAAARSSKNGAGVATRFARMDRSV